MIIYYFLNSKANVVTNWNPLNSVNIFFSLFLIADSVSLKCSSGLKKLKFQRYRNLIALKACARFIIFTFFVQRIFTFFVSLNKGLLEPFSVNLVANNDKYFFSDVSLSNDYFL